MGKILSLVFVLYIAQCFFVHLQMKHFKSTVKNFMNKGYVGIGVKKGKISAGKVIVLVSDNRGQIIEAKQMKGITLLARFKRINCWEGINYKILRQKILLKKKKNLTLIQALENLEEKLMAL